MAGPAKTALGDILDTLVKDLDISPSKYREAVSHYEAIGNWLDANNSPIHPLKPSISPQGSFRLGTVVRPIRDGKEANYDIDLVCKLTATKANISPSAIKSMVGDRLKSHAQYAKMLDAEGRRCWTIEYAEVDGLGFHADVLPSIPGTNSSLNGNAFSSFQIDITEKLSDGSYVWAPGGSNPEGFARWFMEINETSFLREVARQKGMLFETNRDLYETVDAVPDAMVRTPLQRTVQILKRHRDFRFNGHELEQDKPISMIITTLAATAYRGEQDTELALTNIIDRIENYVTTGLIRKSGRLWEIPNPVNPTENFADRWNASGSNRADAFFAWLGWLQQDITTAKERAFEADSRRDLSEALGISSARDKTGTNVPSKFAPVAPIGSTSHRQAPPWPINVRYSVNVTGKVRRSLTSLENLFRLTRRPVKKHFAIAFHAETDTPPPYSIKWQIVNTGAEATAAGRHELRGGFDDGNPPYGNTRLEQTKFAGTHTIEAFVIKDDVCVARSGEQRVSIAAT